MLASFYTHIQAGSAADAPFGDISPPPRPLSAITWPSSRLCCCCCQPVFPFPLGLLVVVPLLGSTANHLFSGLSLFLRAKKKPPKSSFFAPPWQSMPLRPVCPPARPEDHEGN